MNRYGIPKEDNVELKQNVENCSSSGSSIKHVTKYYSIKQDLPDELKELIYYGSTVKVKYGSAFYINPTMFVQDSSLTLVGFSFNPLYTEITETNMYIDSIEELFIIMGVSELILPYIQRITEEEFYKID